MENPNEIVTIWTYIERGGLIFFLFLNLYLLFRGDIISKPVVNKMLEVGDKRAEILATQISKSMGDIVEKSVEIGVAKAIQAFNQEGRSRKRT